MEKWLTYNNNNNNNVALIASNHFIFVAIVMFDHGSLLTLRTMGERTCKRGKREKLMRHIGHDEHTSLHYKV